LVLLLELQLKKKEALMPLKKITNYLYIKVLRVQHF